MGQPIMPHINLNNNFPGIRSALAYSPQTAAPLGLLAEILLRNNEGLTPGERELIGMYVSYLNDCFYCHHSHGEIACIYLGGDRTLVEQVKNDYTKANISDKLKSLLAIAAKVQQGGKFVTTADIENAKANEATDKDIHDTVWTTWAPEDKGYYIERAKQRAEEGYAGYDASK